MVPKKVQWKTSCKEGEGRAGKDVSRGGTRFVRFFFGQLVEVTRRFTNLFGRAVEGDDEGNGRPDLGTGFTEKYGWIVVVDRLAGNDVLKWDAVFDLPAIEFLNYASYQVEKSKHEAFEVKRQSKLR